MSLVTLIQKLNSEERDAVVQIEDWALPLVAKFTGELDAAGRKVFTLFDEVKANVEVELKTVISEVANTSLANTVVHDFDSLEAEIDKAADEVVQTLGNT